MVHISDMSSGKLTVSKTYSLTSGRRVPCITAKPRMGPQFQKLFFVLNHKTRMHSSRMRATHLLTVSRSAQWGICLGVVCLGGASAQGDVCPMACWDTPRPPWTEFLTHACKNITFPQLLFRVVITWPEP